MGNQTNRQSRNQKTRIAASRRSSLQQSASVSAVGNTNSSTADLAIDTAAKAMMLAQAGQLEPARLLCCQALENDPDNAQAWHVLGMTMHLAGEAKLAIDSLQKSADLATPDAALLCNLGVAHAELGQQSEAVANYRHALKLQPNQPETHNNLANALQALGQLSEAADHYRCAVQLRPSYTDATTNLGTVLERLGDLAGASAMYLRTLETNPADVTALNNLGSVLSRQEQNAEAIECLKLALELKPDSAAAYSNLAFVFAKQGNHSDVLDLLRTAMELDPAYASNYLFMLSKDPTASRQEIFAQHQRWGQAVEQSIAAFVHDRGTDPYRKLRIGYVSPDLREHVVAKYIEPILQHHDGEQIETFCYAEVFSPDAATDRMKQLATHWRSTCGQTSANVADQIRQDKIDILVDLAGHTAQNRLDVFAYQAAPVQVAWIGYPHTTGLSRINYRITSEFQDSADEACFYTEKLVRLPEGSAVLAPPADAPAVVSLPAMQRGFVTFGSLHRLDKITDATFDRWSKIIRSVDHSRLLVYWPTLHGARRDWMQSELIQRGITADRIDLRSDAGDDGYLSVYNEIDIGLDPTPWTGSTTTKEALWMGVAVLALYGHRRSSRGSAVVLNQIGLDELIVQSEGDYIEAAVRLAGDLPRLADLRASLRPRMQQRLQSAEAFTRVLESTYRQLWQDWCEN